MADELLHRFLAERDAPCPVCRYNLRGLTADTCPECAAPLRLELASPNLHVGPFVLVVVSFALGAGFDLVVAAIFSVAFFASAIQGAPATWVAPLIMVGTLGGLGAVCVGGILLLVRKRPAWNRLPRRRQWRAGVLTFLGVGTIHAVAGALIVVFIA